MNLQKKVEETVKKSFIKAIGYYVNYRIWKIKLKSNTIQERVTFAQKFFKVIATISSAMFSQLGWRRFFIIFISLFNQFTRDPYTILQ